MAQSQRFNLPVADSDSSIQKKKDFFARSTLHQSNYRKTEKRYLKGKRERH